ncbi:hypothetical protein [Streptantibioticus ferralitis]|uniref:Uncharacterized protein n=1 Tax=Streptantibioticus ferralitis TaxID=236510 RepID=A0ABT5Z3I7_9ACTN|nr:hypothetical protein [Streptantibioticus ferralitis]MDF2258227.1 hypothetical protein [Streptantibioticus ferralitis]
MREPALTGRKELPPAQRGERPSAGPGRVGARRPVPRRLDLLAGQLDLGGRHQRRRTRVGRLRRPGQPAGRGRRQAEPRLRQPKLYAAKGTGFHDITSGSNGAYSATKGWDFASGWGSYNASTLAAKLLGY